MVFIFSRNLTILLSRRTFYTFSQAEILRGQIAFVLELVDIGGKCKKPAAEVRLFHPDRGGRNREREGKGKGGRGMGGLF